MDRVDDTCLVLGLLFELSQPLDREVCRWKFTPGWYVLVAGEVVCVRHDGPVVQADRKPFSIEPDLVGFKVAVARPVLDGYPRYAVLVNRPRFFCSQVWWYARHFRLQQSSLSGFCMALTRASHHAAILIPCQHHDDNGFEFGNS